MCGRYQFTASRNDPYLRAVLKQMDARFPNSYQTGDVHPGDRAVGIVANSDKLLAVPAVFGWPSYDKKLLINARAETAAQKPTFSEALRLRRIVLPASGFYEWTHDDAHLQYFFDLENRTVFYLAGLYRIDDGVLRFVILTRAANESMRPVHDRMPVILSAASSRSPAWATSRPSSGMRSCASTTCAPT